MATTVAGLAVKFNDDGKSVHVTLTAAVAMGSLIYADGWLGIASSKGVSGDVIALQADDRAYQFKVPASLAVAKGEIVYITVATVTGHYPNDEAYVKAPAAGAIALFKAITAKDANNMVIGVMLAHNALPYVS